MADHAAVTKGISLSNKAYDTLRKLVEFGLPALGTFYFTLNQIWGPALFANPEKVTGTLAAIAVVGSLVLRLSRVAYANSDAAHDGEVVENDDPEAEHKYLLQLNAPMDELVAGKSVISFKVQAPSA